MEIKNYIDGKLMPPTNDNYIDNVNPATGKTYSKVPESTIEDLELAVESAERVFPIWSQMPIEKRSRILMKLADLIEENLDELAEYETMDSGKPLQLSKSVDIPRSSANFRFFASAIVNFSSESHIMEGEAVNYTRRGPIGVVGCISPWNLPLYLFSWKIAPALAMGNCVIGKPSELTPLTAFKLSELAIKAGIPAGVLNILHGTGPSIGQPIVDHQKIKAISFTGGTSTGKIIGESCARQIKKVSLELGGKNPNIIFSDADFDEAVKTSVKSSFSNQGEICLCGSRIFIEQSIYDSFKEQFVDAVAKLRIGDPLTEVQMGALISEAHMNKVLGYIQVAKDEGGKILTGGNRIEEQDGFFVEPTVIEGLNASCSINQEEIFGPVVTLIPFESDTEVIEAANSSEYGLAATLWTNDLKKAHRVSHALKSGIVWVNCWLLRDLRTPFGGMKNSGIGREGGNEALRFFSEPQNICIKL